MKNEIQNKTIGNKILKTNEIKRQLNDINKIEKNDKIIQIGNELIDLVLLMELTETEYKAFLFMLRHTRMNSKAREFHSVSIEKFLKQYNFKEEGITFYKNAFKSLRDESVWKNDVLIGILDKVKYDRKNKEIIFRYDEDFEKFLLDLKDHYLLTWAINAELLPDKSSSFLYIFLRRYLFEGELVISYYDLKQKITEPKIKRNKKEKTERKLEISEYKYGRYWDWKTKVLDVAILLINKFTDIYVSYKENGTKDEERTFYFKIVENEKNSDMQFINDSSKRILINKDAEKRLNEEIEKFEEKSNDNQVIAERLNKYFAKKINNDGIKYTNRIKELIDKYNIKEEIFEVILDIASLKTNLKGGYIDTLVENWKERGIDTIDEAKQIYKSYIKMERDIKMKNAPNFEKWLSINFYKYDPVTYKEKELSKEEREELYNKYIEEIDSGKWEEK